jgi:hypothetical protein
MIVTTAPLRSRLSFRFRAARVSKRYAGWQFYAVPEILIV